MEEEVAISVVGINVRIYGRTKKGGKLFAGKIKSVDFKMDKQKLSCVVEMAADTSKTKEFKSRSVSRNPETHVARRIHLQKVNLAWLTT